MLNAITSDKIKNSKYLWPPTPNAMSNQLQRKASALRKVGVFINKNKTNKSRFIEVKILDKFKKFF